MKWFTRFAAKGSQRRVHLYTFSWNEERMLPFFFRHYDSFVDRYVFYDDSSSDATLEILANHPKVEVRRFERTTPGSYVASALTLQNSMWKESRGLCDWVIVTAADEHLHHPNMNDYLARATRKGITAIPSLGYEMVSTEFPDSRLHLASSLVWGTPAVLMSRFSLFNPDAIEETRFTPGQHYAEPFGKVCYPSRDDLLNLHYKMLGREYVCSRYALLRSGLGEVDRAN